MRAAPQQTLPVAVSCLALLASSAAAAAAAKTVTDHAGAKSVTKYLFAFGDSYSDVGFSVAGAKPSRENPIGNPPYPGKTTSGGANWVGELVTRHAGNSLALAYDFASSGATVDQALVGGSGTSLVVQIEQRWAPALKSHPGFAPWTSADTLAVVWIGINDLANPFWEGVEPPISAVADRYFALLQRLQAAGVAHFALMTVPPLELVLAFAGKDKTRLLKLRSNIARFNAELSSRLTVFKSAHPTVASAIVFDTDNAFRKIITNPASVGANNSWCVGPSPDCLWHDGYHPGIAIHQEVARQLAETVNFF